MDRVNGHEDCDQTVQHCWFIILLISVEQEQESRGQKQRCCTNNAEQFDASLTFP